MIIKGTPTKFKEAFQLDTVARIFAEEKVGIHQNSPTLGEDGNCEVKPLAHLK